MGLDYRRSSRAYHRHHWGHTVTPEVTAADRVRAENVVFRWRESGPWIDAAERDHVLIRDIIQALAAARAEGEQLIGELRDSARFLTDGIDELIRERDEHERKRDVAVARVTALEAALREMRNLWPIHLHSGMVRMLTVEDVKRIAALDTTLAPRDGGT
jgi:hypothetical protein